MHDDHRRLAGAAVGGPLGPIAAKAAPTSPATAAACLASFFLCFVIALPAFGTVDQRLKVEGTWDGKRILVERLKLRDPGKDINRIRIVGEVQALDLARRRFMVGPAELVWEAEQDVFVESFRNGAIVQADAHRLVGQRFKLINMEEDELDDGNDIELIGTVTAAQRAGQDNAIELAGISTLIPRRLYSNGRVRRQRLDDKRPAEQFRFSVGTVDVTLGGEVEWVSDAERNRDLNDDEDDDALDAEFGAQLEGYFELKDSVSMFLEVEAEHARDYDLPLRETGRGTEISRGETWAYFDQLFAWPVSLQVGRQNFAEQREWWWDDNLDAIRLFYETPNFDAELAVAEEVADEILSGGQDDADEDDIFRILGTARWRHSSLLSLQGFFLYHRDHSDAFLPGQQISESAEDDEDSTLTWLGARATGELEPQQYVEISYWLDTAVVRGDETLFELDDSLASGLLLVTDVTERRRRGWAVDAGVSFTWRGKYQPTLTLGFARGSGDEDGDGGFRETGLNDNNDKFNGVDRFRYYGELTRPELSNIDVSTLALGVRLGRNSSLELLYHGYQQVVPSVDHGLRIDVDANGSSSHLGDEIDLVIGVEEWEHWELEFVGGYFRPGAAFVDEDSAWLATVKLNYNF